MLRLYKTFVFLIHGLDSTKNSMKVIEQFLLYQGYFHVYNLEYDSCNLSLVESTKIIYKQISEIINVNIDDENSILIGHSLGGLISMKINEICNFKPRLSISICSPLQGSEMLNILKKNLPKKIQDHYYKPVYEDLMKMTKKYNKNPVHNYKTISSTLIPYIKFDGLIWVEEMKYDNELNHNMILHDHFTIVFSPFLLYSLNRILNQL